MNDGGCFLSASDSALRYSGHAQEQQAAGDGYTAHQIEHVNVGTYVVSEITWNRKGKVYLSLYYSIRTYSVKLNLNN